jgi:hypothetical protein
VSRWGLEEFIPELPKGWSTLTMSDSPTCEQSSSRGQLRTRVAPSLAKPQFGDGPAWEFLAQNATIVSTVSTRGDLPRFASSERELASETVALVASVAQEGEESNGRFGRPEGENRGNGGFALLHRGRTFNPSA